jgi:hypothetical protein
MYPCSVVDQFPRWIVHQQSRLDCSEFRYPAEHCDLIGDPLQIYADRFSGLYAITVGWKLPPFTSFEYFSLYEP